MTLPKSLLQPALPPAQLPQQQVVRQPQSAHLQVPVQVLVPVPVAPLAGRACTMPPMNQCRPLRKQLMQRQTRSMMPWMMELWQRRALLKPCQSPLSKLQQLTTWRSNNPALTLPRFMMHLKSLAPPPQRQPLPHPTQAMTCLKRTRRRLVANSLACCMSSPLSLAPAPLLLQRQPRGVAERQAQALPQMMMLLLLLPPRPAPPLLRLTITCLFRLYRAWCVTEAFQATLRSLRMRKRLHRPPQQVALGVRPELQQ